MASILNIMPDLDADEMAFVQNLVKDMSDAEVQQFASIYRSRRREPMLILGTTLLGFFMVAGVQRFLVGQIGMGVLYLLTGGLCAIGTIVDLINFRRIAFENNIKEAQLVVAMMGGNYNRF
ncbi:TM2 domain-containing protein [Pontibacter harenae]|uniref:TM2 domain-containing protein n=1 Tax=Pontibacter harenae TaxID=2894083 RepID=UPI001E5D1AD1|nr:TM2 domain-containing protein [Pontibacter harenae]MCC9168163.1 TM2 domain-containing protein [Pontibacter harenae]